MTFYILDSLTDMDNEKFTYFRVDISDDKSKDLTLYGKDFKYRFIKGDRDLFINRVDRMKRRGFNSLCWVYKDVCNNNNADICLYDKNSLEFELTDPKNIEGLIQVLVSSKYFSRDIKSKFKVLKSLNDDFKHSYLLEAEIRKFM